MKRQDIRVPTYRCCRPRSAAASKCARAASRKSGNIPEMVLRRHLYAAGLRFRVTTQIEGRPDIVFFRARVLVFVDGDFWHGRNINKRLEKLRCGHNGEYWTAKILSNR